jgi:hypothetical protein
MPKEIEVVNSGTTAELAYGSVVHLRDLGSNLLTD